MTNSTFHNESSRRRIIWNVFYSPTKLVSVSYISIKQQVYNNLTAQWFLYFINLSFYPKTSTLVPLFHFYLDNKGMCLKISESV